MGIGGERCPAREGIGGERVSKESGNRGIEGVQGEWE